MLIKSADEKSKRLAMLEDGHYKDSPRNVLLSEPMANKLCAMAGTAKVFHLPIHYFFKR